METMSMKKRIMITNVVFSFLLLLVAVQAQETFPSDYSSSDSEQTSMLSLSEFPKDSEDINVPTETEQQPMETDSNTEIISPLQSPATFETSLSTKTPPPPKRPNNICRTTCDRKCMRKKVPLLNNLCYKACRNKCRHLHLQAIYDCTNHCEMSMPKNFKSDKKKTEGYVINCYRKCIKKF